MLNRPSLESVDVICPSGTERCGMVKKGEFFVKMPKQNKRPPNNNSGQNIFVEKLYNQGDTINIKPINTSSTMCIWRGNRLMKPVSLSAKTAMMNCNHPIYIGRNKAALEILTNPNSHGEATSVILMI